MKAAKIERKSSTYWNDYDNELNSIHDERKINYIETCKKLGIPTVTSFMQNMNKSYLNLARYGIGEKAIEGIVMDLKGNVGIASLDLTDNNLGEAGIKSLASIFHKNFNIKRLNVSHNLISDDGAADLLSYLESYNVLEYLNLSGNRIGDAVCVEIRQFLTLNKSVKSFVLSKNNLEACGEYIKEGLENNSVLEELDLSWNQLRSSSCVTILTCLSTNKYLRSLNLAWNHCQGNSAIGESLSVNTSLLELDLSYNNISSRGAIGMSPGLESNKSLQVLRLKKNSYIDPEAIQNILETLLLNRKSGLTTLDLDGIMASPENHDTIDKLKTRRPSLDILVGGYIKTNINDDNATPAKTWRDDVIQMLSEYLTKHKLRAVELFNRWDLNKKRSLNRVEFTKGIKSCKLAIKKWQIDMLFSYLNRNNKGCVQYRDFVELFRSSKK